jgi:multidrug efflux pump subunit AcrB
MWHRLMIRLLAIDIDGTLLDSHGQLPDANRDALAAASARGVEVALATGRSFHFTRPIANLLPIPLTLIGILPAHWLGGVFFTATSMIGMIAGAGIVVRNSIILVDFIELKRADGMPLEEAVIEAGVQRFRPMLLTAAAVVVGASVILFDPIFQGLAVALMAGEIASTILSRTAVPVFYYMMAKKNSGNVER